MKIMTTEKPNKPGEVHDPSRQPDPEPMSPRSPEPERKLPPESPAPIKLPGKGPNEPMKPQGR